MANYALYTRLTRNNGNVVESTRTITNPPLATEYDSPVAANQTNLQLEPFAVDVSDLLLWVIMSDQDLTIKTNSSSVPDDTITVKAGVPIIWDSESGAANPLTADVTDLFITNTTAISRLYILAVMDAA